MHTFHNFFYVLLLFDNIISFRNISLSSWNIANITLNTNQSIIQNDRILLIYIIRGMTISRKYKTVGLRSYILLPWSRIKKFWLFFFLQICITNLINWTFCFWFFGTNFFKLNKNDIIVQACFHTIHCMHEFDSNTPCYK